MPRQPSSTLFPYTTLFRSRDGARQGAERHTRDDALRGPQRDSAAAERLRRAVRDRGRELRGEAVQRSEEHTSELQSHVNLVCRLLLEKKKKYTYHESYHHS